MTPDPAAPPPDEPPIAEPTPWAVADTATVFLQAVRSDPLHPAAGLTGPSPSRRTVALIAGAVAVVVVLAAIGTAFAVKNSGTIAPIVVPSGRPAGGGAPEPTQAPVDSGVYQAPGDLCDESDFTRLRPTFDTLDSLSPHATNTASYIVVGCDGAAGNGTVQGTFSFEVQVSADPTALAGVFDEDRSAAAAHGQVTPLPGVGTRAYSYVQTGQAGLAVNIYDANLIMSLSWTPAHRTDPLPAGLTDALVATCQSNLGLFRRR